MEKIREAIKKINNEIQKNPDDTYTALIGEYVIDHINTEDDADKVLREERTLVKALEEIQNKAKQSAVNGVAAIEDSTVYGWALEYFKLMPASASAPAQKKQEQTGVCLNLEDFF